LLIGSKIRVSFIFVFQRQRNDELKIATGITSLVGDPSGACWNDQVLSTTCSFYYLIFLVHL